MREWFQNHIGKLVQVGLVLVSLAMLAVLSWGISQSNLAASMIAGAVLAVAIVMAGSVILVPDNLRSQATERTLRLASSTLSHMRGGLTPENCMAVCQLLLPETQASAIAMTDTHHVLAYVGEKPTPYPQGSPNNAPTLEVLQSGHIETFSAGDIAAHEGQESGKAHGVEGFPVGVIVPLIVSDKSVGTLKLYYQHGYQVDRTQLKIARGFAELLSTQLMAYELDQQAELTARAEVKALQAQINPHFLFNTLNTIASFTRTNPTKARDLLREFSVFYRRTLENSDSLIALSRELEQTRRYLKIERARFGEDRILEEEHVEKGLEGVMVPSFLVQPIVENSVRHAMRDEGPLHIDIHVATDGNDVLIAVADDGLGMEKDVAAHLMDPHAPTHGAKGTGIALHNVDERIRRFYGEGSCIEVMSKVGEGTCVTLRLAGAAPKINNRTVSTDKG